MHPLKERFELTGEQLEKINERLDEAEEASKRMGRKDWLIYFLGTISALTIAATVVPGVSSSRRRSLRPISITERGRVTVATRTRTRRYASGHARRR
jgi:hypothetical protein